MKTMTCRQLGGACDETFRANTFEEMAELSKQHGLAMFQKGDAPHREAMENMRTLMHQPGAMQKWFNEKRKEFETLPDQ